MRAISGPGAEARLEAEIRCLEAGAKVWGEGGALPPPHEPHPVVVVPTRGPPVRVRLRPTVGYVFCPKEEIEAAAAVAARAGGPPGGAGPRAVAGATSALVTREGEAWGGRKVQVLKAGKPSKAAGLPWGEEAEFTWWVGEVSWTKRLVEKRAGAVGRLVGWAASILYDPRGVWGLGEREGLEGLPALGAPEPRAAGRAEALEAEIEEWGGALLLWPGGRLSWLGPRFELQAGKKKLPPYEELHPGEVGPHEVCRACRGPAWGEGVEVRGEWICEACWRVGLRPPAAAKLKKLEPFRRGRLERGGGEACRANGLPEAAAAAEARAEAPEGGEGAVVLEWGGGVKVVCVPPALGPEPEYTNAVVREAVRGGAALARLKTALVSEGEGPAPAPA